jgi:hypothetical protein
MDDLPKPYWRYRFVLWLIAFDEWLHIYLPDCLENTMIRAKFCMWAFSEWVEGNYWDAWHEAMRKDQ